MPDKNRFAIPKKFEASSVTLFPGEAHAMAVPVAGIAGLASYGFISLLEAQLVGGPKTIDYTNDTAAHLSIYLSNGWKPGDSPGIMRRKFQLTRALALIATRRNKGSKKPPVTFAAALDHVVKFSDAERQGIWLRKDFQAEVAPWNTKPTERKPVAVPEALKGMIG